MDVKPSNILVNDNQDLILIDWEQSSATKWMRAPEIDGTLHAEEMSSPSRSSKLIYTKYSSLPPQPNPDRKGVVDLWHEHCPRAVEKAEVYMLGKTMWMLLQQVTESEAYEACKESFRMSERRGCRVGGKMLWVIVFVKIQMRGRGWRG